MKITNNSPIRPVSVGQQGETKNVKAPAEGKSDAAASNSTVNHTSQAALSDPTHDIDGARVEELKQAILDGKMEIDSGKIADGLIENLKGL